MGEYTLMLPKLLEKIEILKTATGDKVEFVNQVISKDHTLISSRDLADQNIIQNNILPVNLYLQHVLIVKAEKEFNNININPIQTQFENFKTYIFKQILCIEKTCALLCDLYDEHKPSRFLTNFSNGLLTNLQDFKNSFQNVILYITKDEPTRDYQMKKVAYLFEEFQRELENFEKNPASKVNSLNSNNQLPKKITKIDEVLINQDQWIPDTNGIDIHPYKNIYVASTLNGGDMVIRDLCLNKELHRVQMKHNSGSFAVDNYLWSPSGQQILVSCYKRSAGIKIFSNEGKLLKTIKNASAKSPVWGALWLNETTIAIGHADGSLRIFNVDKSEETGCLYVDGESVWGMDNLDDAHLLTGDSSGMMKKINWKDKSIVLSIQCHEKNYGFSVIKVAANKLNALSGSGDYHVKCISIKDMKIKWGFKMNSFVLGISYCDKSSAALVISDYQQLVILELKTGIALIEFYDLSMHTHTLKFNKETDEIFIGNEKGYVERFQLWYQFLQQKLMQFQSFRK